MNTSGSKCFLTFREKRLLFKDDHLELDKLRYASEVTDLCQNEPMGADEAKKIASLQDEFIRSSLQDGLQQLKNFENGENLQNRDLQSVFKRIQKHFKTIRTHEESHTSQEFLNFSETLASIYEEIHSKKGLSEREKLFCEFLLGLGNFDLATQMSLFVSEKLLPHEKVQSIRKECQERIDNLMIPGLEQTVKVATAIGEAFLEEFSGRSNEFWSTLHDKILEDPNLQQAAQNLVSMRYIPNDTGVVSMAQNLHWKGFGGGGEYLKEFPDLEFLASQSLGWHDGSKQTGSNFGKRLQLFADALNPLKQRAFQIIGAYLNMQFPNEESLKVFDGCSGPKGAGISGICDHTSQQVNLSIGDVSGASISEAHKKIGKNSSETGLPENLRITEVYYQDLMHSLEKGELATKKDEFHCVSFAIGAHQLMDTKIGRESALKEIFSFATKIAKTGGVISFPDAGQNVYIQFPIIPANLVDREGCVPQNIYEHISFESVSVDAGNGMVKIPYRLSKLRYATPEKLAEKAGTGLYEFNVFIVVEIPQIELASLDDFRESGQFDECDKIIQKYLDISKIQKDILAKIEETAPHEDT